MYKCYVYIPSCTTQRLKSVSASQVSMKQFCLSAPSTIVYGQKLAYQYVV